MLPITQGQDPDTPTYMEALSGSIIYHVGRSEGQQGDSTEVILLGVIKWDFLMLKVKSICYMMGVIIECSVREISHCYWMILNIISYEGAIDTSYDTIL